MEVWREMLAVAATLLLVGALVWLLRRGSGMSRAVSGLGWLRTAGGGNVPAPLERVGRLALTPQHALHLIRVRGSEMVVATHPQGCSVFSSVHPAIAGTPVPSSPESSGLNAREARA